MQTRCPGQDTRFWQPGDVFEVPCAECGYEVEFFKDDAIRRCRSCGARVSNPQLNLGCAQWCEHAKECLGYDPKEREAEAGLGDQTLIDRLLEAVKRELGQDRAAFGRAVAVMEQAQRLIAQKGGSPKVVLTAALLLGLDQGREEPTRAVKLMKELGLDQMTIDEVAQLINNWNLDRADPSPDFKILSNAVHRADLAEESPASTGESKGRGVDRAAAGGAGS